MYIGGMAEREVMTRFYRDRLSVADPLENQCRRSLNEDVCAVR